MSFSTSQVAARVLAVCAVMASFGVQAQIHPQLADCPELKDEVTAPQVDLCLAHIGCRFVLNVQPTCPRAKSYLERLQAAIGKGTKTLFGRRKEVTPDAVFMAALGAENMVSERLLGGDEQAQQTALRIGSRIREVGQGGQTSGKFSDGSAYIYYGELEDGIPKGWGTRIGSTGEIQRGQFDKDMRGESDVLLEGGGRFVGKYGSTSRVGVAVSKDGRVDNGDYDWRANTFSGSRTYVDGTRFQGRSANGQLVEGKLYRTDGTLEEEGKYANGALSVGTKYDVSGARIEVNRPAERQAAERAAAEQARLQAEAEQQRKREQAARAEQQFRASLQTLNPGQLFARADELAAQGDAARARDVRRILVSRFPDHPLAATAARQMAADTSGSPSSPSAATATRPGLSSAVCEDMKRKITTTKVPPNASITASTETVMFMTKTALDMIAGGCATNGATPAQIEAERQERQRQYAAAEQACNAVQSGARRCVPQLHTFTDTVTPLPTARSASSPPSKPQIIYDPNTGTCSPTPCDCRMLGNCSSAGRSSGGGIRTAR